MYNLIWWKQHCVEAHTSGKKDPVTIIVWPQINTRSYSMIQSDKKEKKRSLF